MTTLMVAGVAAMAIALVLSTISAQAAQTGTRTFTNDKQIMIPANRLSGGTGGQASPYPSNIRVTGFKKVTDVNVILHSVGHTDPDDLDVLLQGPTGRTAILWSDAGGNTDILNVNVKLDDEAPIFLPDSGQVFQGKYMTSNYQVGSDSWPGVTQNDNRLLSRFDGTDPAGAWKLFVYDDLAQPDDGNRTGTGTINSAWSLQVKGVCTREREQPLPVKGLLLVD
jgi:subtilisin-like proprotein convertase family protein